MAASFISAAFFPLDPYSLAVLASDSIHSRGADAVVAQQLARRRDMDHSGRRSGNMHLTSIDAIIVAVYAVALFGLAQWVSRERPGHEKTSTDYFLASRSLPWWAIGASLI